MRILLGACRWIGDTDLCEHGDGAFGGFFPRRLRVYAHHFRDLIANGEHWIERRHRLLKNYRHAIAANGAQLFIGEREQVESVKTNCASRLDATG